MPQIPAIFNPGANTIWNGLAGRRLLRADHQDLLAEDYDRIAAELIGIETILQGFPSNITFAPAPGASTVCNITCTLLDANGVAITFPFAFDFFFSDLATGAGLTALTASGAVTGTTGADFGDYTAKKAKKVQCNASGVYVVQITDTARSLFFPCAQIGGRTFVGAKLITGNYG